MTKKSALLACVLAFANTAPTFAGPIPQPYYFPNGSRGVKINYALPAACDGNIKAAVDTINAAGRSFQLTGTTQNYTSTYYTAQDDPDFINIQYGSGLSSIMRTIIYGYASPPTPAQAIDATVYVNADRIYYDSETLSGSPAQLRYLIRRLRQRAPAARIVVGLWPRGEAALSDRDIQREIGADLYVGSLKDAVAAIARDNGRLDRTATTAQAA